MTKWRYISDPPLPGACNMAIDEVLFESFLRNDALPVFRLYRWYPPTLSLGRFQQSDFLDWDYIESRRIDVVRRFSGGGALIHGGDISYSIVCKAESDVDKSYIMLTQFLFDLYRHLGLDPSYACDLETSVYSFGRRNNLCLAGKEKRDIVIAGRKVGGNAQRRKAGALIQHGSIPLRYDRDCLAALGGVSPGGLDNAASLEDLGLDIGIEKLMTTLELVFSRRYGDIRASVLSADERKRASVLEREKYANSACIRNREAMNTCAGL